MKILSLVLSFSVLCSCYTIRFVKSNRAVANADQEYLGVASKMHHIGLLGLYEWSEPASIKRTCGIASDFVFVETYTGFKEWLIRYVGGLMTGGLLHLLWSPHSLEIACYEKTSSDRQIASVDNREFKFKILKIKKKNILIKFLNEVPSIDTFKVGNKSFEVIIVKRIQSRALILAKNVRFKKNKIYKGTY